MPRVKDSNQHRPLVSAALIVRNESHRLERCFESIRPFADEVVVVDTGSVDGSAQLAAEEGARVVEFRWTGDFSEARNIALDVASGEWILYIDADERLRPADTRSVRDRLRSGPPARTVCLHPRPGWTGYREFRLWRSAPAIRFRGAIHETVLPSLTEAVGGDLSAVAPSGLVIDHFGYEGDLDAKYRRNLALLRRELDVDPDRVYLWHDLGCTLAGLGRHDEAEWAWVEAVARVRTKRTEPTPPDHVLPYLSLIAVPGRVWTVRRAARRSASPVSRGQSVVVVAGPAAGQRGGLRRGGRALRSPGRRGSGRPRRGGRRLSSRPLHDVGH